MFACSFHDQQTGRAHLEAGYNPWKKKGRKGKEKSKITLQVTLIR